MRIADVHTHVFPEALAEKASRSICDFYGAAPGHHASIDRLLELEKEADVEVCLICSSAANAGQVAHTNDFLGTTAAAHPECLGLGTLFPGMPNYEEELDRIESYGLRGIKIHPDMQRVALDDPKSIEMYRACAKRGMVVLLHMGDDRYDFSAPARLLNLKRKVPDLIAIAAHFGGYQSWQASAACPQPEGVWYDTSSSLMFLSDDDAKRMLDAFGTERFLFGTDFPMWTPKTEVQRLLDRKLGLSQRELEAIFYGNFARLFHL